MATLREALLPVFQNVARKIPADLGLRTNVVKLRTRTWAQWDGEVGLGAVTTVDTTITPAPKLTFRDGQNHDVVGTPANTAGGYTPAQINPPTTAGSEHVWVIVSPDGQEREYRVRSFNQRRAFGYYLTLEPLDPKAVF